MNKYGHIISFLLPCVVFVISLLALPSYGINWDSYQHLARGQSYFRYIFLNKLDSNDLPNQCVIPPDEWKLGTGRMCSLTETPRISFYEKSPLDVAWANQMTIGHPPLMDIILAGSNRFFYKTLGLVSDVTSYHLAIVTMAFGLALVVALWSYQTTGLFGSVISVLTLYTVPLFFAEQHFNLKDPAIAFLLTLCAYLLWKGIITSKYIWFLAAGMIGGIALGTKFNVVFLVLPILFWLPFSGLVYTKKAIVRVVVSLVGVMIIAWVIFWAGYPAIWNDPIGGTIKVIGYYTEVSNTSSNPCFHIPFSPRWYSCSTFVTPLLFFTTLPIISLVLAGIGSFFVFKKLNMYNAAYLLWFLLLWFPLVRSTLPLVQLYGGSLRQIMEFVGPFSMLAGLGASILYSKLPRRYPKRLVQLLILVLYLPIIVTLIRLNPHQNLFYNSLIGGIQGAKESGLPEVGNTYGNGYKQLIDWINVHAEPHSTVATLVSVGSSFPTTWLRSDLTFKGDDTDMTRPQGEYLLELTVPGMNIDDRFRYRYAMYVLRPVYEHIVEGQIIGRVWKNDSELYQQSVAPQTIILEPHIISPTIVEFDLPDNSNMHELTMHSTNEQCLYALTNGVILGKKAKSNVWERFTEGIAYFNSTVVDISTERRYVFANDPLKQMRIVVTPSSCDLSTIIYKMSLFGSGGGD